MDVQGKLLRDCKITYILVILSMLFVLSIKNMKTISICCQSYLAYLYFLWRVGIAYLLYSWLTSFIPRLQTWMYIFEKAKLFFYHSQLTKLKRLHLEWVRSVQYVTALDALVSSCCETTTAMAVTNMQDMKCKYIAVNKGVICVDYSAVRFFHDTRKCD